MHSSSGCGLSIIDSLDDEVLWQAPIMPDGKSPNGRRVGLGEGASGEHVAAAALHRAAALQEDLEIWAVGGYSFEPPVGFGCDVGGSYDVQPELTSAGGTGSTCPGVGAGRCPPGPGAAPAGCL